MESFLEHLEKNYDTFNMFEGNLSSFKFPRDIMAVLTIIMKKANKLYVDKCKELKKPPYIITEYYLEKDNAGKCYLKVIGADKHTTIIIRQDNSDIENYKKVTGKKMTESEFMQILDFYQKEKLERSGISKRFIKDELPEIEAQEEINTKTLIAYYEYLKEYYLDSITKEQKFIEPDSKDQTYVKRNMGEGIERQRKNDIIDYELRRTELLKYKPYNIYNFVGARSGEEIDVYVYEQDGFIIAIAEPISGESYTRIFNLGYIDSTNTELITANIKAALEASEEIVLLDDAIIRKSHTTIEVFKKNLEVLFNTTADLKKFYNDVEASKSVYRK